MSAHAPHDVAARHLPSIDWIAFGIGALGLALQYRDPAAIGLVALAVFAPSVLRELGLLTDADEFTRVVMHRAGFHAVLATALLVFLNHLLPAVGWFEPATSEFGDSPFPGETLRKAVVWVFLLSYLLQYWGARRGVTRILLGVALMLLISIVGLARHVGEQGFAFIGTTLAATAVFVILAAQVRRWPRAGGITLLGLGLAFVFFSSRDLDDPRLTWGLLSVHLQVLLVFGVTGFALIRSTRHQEE